MRDAVDRLVEERRISDVRAQLETRRDEQPDQRVGNHQTSEPAVDIDALERVTWCHEVQAAIRRQEATTKRRGRSQRSQLIAIPDPGALENARVGCDDRTAEIQVGDRRRDAGNPGTGWQRFGGVMMEPPTAHGRCCRPLNRVCDAHVGNVRERCGRFPRMCRTKKRRGVQVVYFVDRRGPDETSNSSQ